MAGADRPDDHIHRLMGVAGGEHRLPAGADLGRAEHPDAVAVMPRGEERGAGGGMSRRQAGRWSQQEQQQYEQEQYAQQQAQPAAAPAEDPMDNRIEQLKGLADLKAQGVLTDAEFEAQKAKILAG